MSSPINKCHKKELILLYRTKSINNLTLIVSCQKNKANNLEMSTLCIVENHLIINTVYIRYITNKIFFACLLDTSHLAKLFLSFRPHLFSLPLRLYWYWFWRWRWRERCSVGARKVSEWERRPSTSLPISPASPTERSPWSERSGRRGNSSWSNQLTSWGQEATSKRPHMNRLNACTGCHILLR